MQVVYLDANILLAKSAGPEVEKEQYPYADQIFERIKNNEYHAIIPPLVLMEVKFALRRNKATDDALKGMNDTEQIDYVNKESNEAYGSLISELLKLKNVNFKTDRQVDYMSILNSSATMLDSVKGKVKNYKFCKRCCSEDVSYRMYKSAGVDDI